MAQQIKKFLIQNIPADIDYFELYSGVSLSNLSLIQTNIVPDKFGFVRIKINEFRRVPLVYYRWKAVDVFGNKSDYSDVDVIEMTGDQIFDKFLLEEKTPDSKIICYEFQNNTSVIGDPDPLGFRRYRTAIKKADNSITTFASEQILHSNQIDNPTQHAIYLEVQPAKTGPGEKIKIFWRAELSQSADIPPYSQLFNSVNPSSFSGVIEDEAPGSAGIYSFTLTSNSTSGTLIETASYEIVTSDLPVINDFSASNSIISEGDTVTLQWDVSNASEVYIDNGICQVALSGSTVVKPSQTTTYTLVAHSSTNGSVLERELTIEVEHKPIINKFSTDSPQIFKGEAVHLSWAVSNVNFIEITPDIGTVLDSTGVDINNSIDNIEISPSSTTTYTLTAKDKKGQVATDSFTIVVNENPVIELFEITPKNITKNELENITLSYQVANADSITIEGDGNTFTSINPIDSFNTIVSANIPPIIERKVIYTIKALKGTKEVTRSLTFNVKS